MKKALKTSAFIILIISLFALNASAQSKTIEWDYGYEDSERETYTYGGELKLGNNKISTDADRSDFVRTYYEFDVEQSGYYNIEQVSYDDCTAYISQDIRNGVVYGDKEYFVFDNDGFKVYLEEGKCIFGVCFYDFDLSIFDYTYECELNIELIASEITDLQIEDEYLEDIILGYHIGTEYDENNTGGIYAEGKIIFDNGKELEFSEWIGVKYPENIAKGENVITFVLPNYKKSYTVQIKTVDDYIKYIEIGNAEDVAFVKETFMPDVVYSIDPEYFELILTMPDGSKKTELVEYYYDIELKGDRLLTVWCDYYQKEDGKWYLTVSVGNDEYLRIPCETVPASFSENYIVYWESVAEYTFSMLDETSSWFSNAFDILSELSFKERTEYISNGFTAISNYYSGIYNLTEMFIGYVA